MVLDFTHTEMSILCQSQLNTAFDLDSLFQAVHFSSLEISPGSSMEIAAQKGKCLSRYHCSCNSLSEAKASYN